MQSPQKGYSGSMVKRLSKQSLDFLGKFSSNCDEAITLIQAELESKPGQITNKASNHTPCFDEKRMKIIMKEACEEAIRPFVGN